MTQRLLEPMTHEGLLAWMDFARTEQDRELAPIRARIAATERRTRELQDRAAVVLAKMQKDTMDMINDFRADLLSMR